MIIKKQQTNNHSQNKTKQIKKQKAEQSIIMVV